MSRVIWWGVVAATVWPSNWAAANMTIAAQGVGGLVPVKTDQISLEREDLYISARQVKVRYELRNHSGKEIVAPILFPLPEFDLYLDYNDIFVPPIQAGDRPLSPTVRVDGREAIVQWLPHAYARDGREITGLLAALGISPFASSSFLDIRRRLPEGTLKDLVDQGIVARWGGEQSDMLSPNWTVRAAFTWQQNFPADRSLVVEVEYPPLTGGYEGEIKVPAGADPNELAASFSMNSAKGHFVPWSEEYCFTGETVAALAGNGDHYAQVLWTRYILVTAMNWEGPIRHFHLTVDKGKPDAVVAFCAPDRKAPIRQTGPTTYEVDIPDFFPERNFDLLTVGKTP